MHVEGINQIKECVGEVAQLNRMTNMNDQERQRDGDMSKRDLNMNRMVEAEVNRDEWKRNIPCALKASLPTSTSSFDAQHPNLMACQPPLSFV